MDTQEQTDYKRIAAAIEFIQVRFKDQPSLEEMAQHIHLSPFHFQRLFTRWAGTSPKKFLQYISLEHSKKILTNTTATITEAAYDTGLSGSSRLHDLFIQIEGMTPGEYKQGGKNLTIHYHFSKSPFGDLLIASTPKGICWLAFYEDARQALNSLKQKFPLAIFTQKQDGLQQNALLVFEQDWTHLSQIKLHLKGTEFQLKVWESLLKIPSGGLATYGQMASQVGNPSASRAVGTAIGSNPVAYLIPCHRVIQSSGNLGGYMWGTHRKKAMIGWEQAQRHESIQLVTL